MTPDGQIPMQPIAPVPPKPGLAERLRSATLQPHGAQTGRSWPRRRQRAEARVGGAITSVALKGSRRQGALDNAAIRKP
jgi:hypothetical protein